MTKAGRQLIASAILDWKRHNKGTQAELALKCGLRPNNFNEIIRGKRTAGIINLIRIAAQLEGYICFRELGRVLHPNLYRLRPDIFAGKEGKNEL